MPANILNKSPSPTPVQSAVTKPTAAKTEPKIVKPTNSPFISRHPATANITFTKLLSAYPNYGNPSKNADILYSGNKGSWNIAVPSYLLIPDKLKAQLIIRAALDDHIKVPANRYAVKIFINGVQLYGGRFALEHGSPAGSVFANWKELSFSVQNLREDNTITIENISSAGTADWIGFDRMELRLLPR
jgi:hypothetical protein